MHPTIQGVTQMQREHRLWKSITDSSRGLRGKGRWIGSGNKGIDCFIFFHLSSCTALPGYLDSVHWYQLWKDLESWVGQGERIWGHLCEQVSLASCWNAGSWSIMSCLVVQFVPRVLLFGWRGKLVSDALYTFHVEVILETNKHINKQINRRSMI